MSVVHVEKSFFQGVTGDLGNLDEMKTEIDQAMGEPRCREDVAGKTLTPEFIASDSYQDFLQDNSYRWIIRNFLINALLSGEMSVDQYHTALQLVSDYQGREQLVASIMLPASLDPSSVLG